jgi:hypothetical protein
LRVSAEQSLNWSDENEDEPGAQQQDSSVLRELRKAHNAQLKRIKELEEQVASYSKETRSRSVKELLASRDLNPKIASFIPEDVEGEEALGKWLDDNADVFGGAPAAASQAPPASIAALRQMDAVGSVSQPPVGGNDLMAAIASAQSREDLDAIIARGIGR